MSFTDITEMMTCGDERALRFKWNIEADKMGISIVNKDQPHTHTRAC